jgi:hypothetical protein
MKPTIETDAMRALSDLYRSESDLYRSESDLYRSEAERIDSTYIQNVATSAFEPGFIDKQVDVSLEEWISSVRARQPKSSGVSEETAWKILAITFASVGLAGFLTILLTDNAPILFQARAGTSNPPQSCFDPPPATVSTPSLLSPTSAGPIPSTVSAATDVRSRETITKERSSKTDGTRKKPIQKDKDRTEDNDGLDFFKDCGMDPMCGYDKKKDAAHLKHRRAE